MKSLPVINPVSILAMSDTEDALGMGQRDLNKIIDIHNKVSR